MTNGWSNWESFIQKYEYNNVSSYKPKVTVTIYGSYNPPSEKVLLNELKTILINDGYKQTRLVDDIKEVEKNSNALDKSKMCLRFSDINLLIFTRKGKRYGVIRELAFLAEDPSMIDKILFCKVFDEVKDEKSSVPPLSLEDVRQAQIPMRAYRSIKELKSVIIRETYLTLRLWIRKYQT